MSLFGDLGDETEGFSERQNIPDLQFDKTEQLKFEKEMLGLYVSDHPLMGIEGALRRRVDCSIPEALERDDGAFMVVGGIVNGLARKYTRKGDQMATFQLEDLLLVISKAMQKDEKNYWLLQEADEVVKAYKTLTKREKEVCRLLINGLLSKEIAKQLEISNATVKVHKGHVMEKLKVNSLQDLVKIAIKHALH